ncbi:MAG: hypothetical protein GXP32_06605 [Kiritimatiellaeota bacterium]|nr:hypothetical protein [Kiritimatiellota bacterium]
MITASIAVNKMIKPSLIKDFGVALATVIIFQNSKKCNVTIANLDNEGFVRLVEAIFCDYRVVKTFGKDNIAIRKKEWLSEIE